MPTPSMPGPKASPDRLVALQSGTTARRPLVELNGYEYFEAATGRVYSMSEEELRRVDAEAGRGGLEWLVLVTRDGRRH